MGEEKDKRVYDTFEKKKVIVKERTSSFHVIVFIIAIVLFVFAVYKYGVKYNNEKYFIRVPSTIHTIEEDGNRYNLSYMYYIKKEPYMIKVPFTTSFKVPLNIEKTVAYNVEDPTDAVFKYSNYYAYLIAFSVILIVLNIESMIKEKVSEKNKHNMSLIMLGTIGLYITVSFLIFYAFFFEIFNFYKLFVLIPTQLTITLIFVLLSIGILLINIISLLIKKGFSEE